MENLRYIRKIRKLSMKQVGKMIGVSESTISLYENGKRQPDNDTLKRLSSALNVSTDFLLGNSSPISICDKISFLMDCCGISNRRLAHKLQIEEETVIKWKSGEIEPTAEQLIEMSLIFGVASDYMLFEYNYVPLQFLNLNDNEFVALDIYRETSGYLIGESSIYSQEEKENVYPILKTIKKQAADTQPVTEIEQELLTLTADMDEDERNAVLGYAARILAKRKKED